MAQTEEGYENRLQAIVIQIGEADNLGQPLGLFPPR